MAIFKGAGVAIVTPMKEDLTINYDKLDEMLEEQIAEGTDAIIICGTTGESATLTHEEHAECIRYAVERTAKRVPVVAGTGSNDTAYAITLSQHAEAVGADALLLVTPYYNKASQRGLIRHFTAIANAVHLPCILYNVPSRTGCNLLPATLAELAKIPNINGVKEASGSLAQASEIAALCGDELNLYSGNDDQVVPLLSLGGKGVISVVSNVAPTLVHDCCAAWFAGDTAKARALQLEMLPLSDALFCDVNPIPVKYAMNLLGWKAGKCRLPLVEPDDNKKAVIERALRSAGLLQE